MIAEVKYPAGTGTYLAAQAYWCANKDEFDDARDDFVFRCEQDGFRIANFLAYNPPIHKLLSIGWLAFIFNRVQKPPKPVRCDGGIEN